MLAPDSDENGSLPLMLTKLRQCLMDWLDNPDNFVIDAFFTSLSAALADLSFEKHASEATLHKVMRAQHICIVFFDFCRPQLRALYKVPIFGFHFRHFIWIAEQVCVLRIWHTHNKRLSALKKCLTSPSRL